MVFESIARHLAHKFSGWIDTFSLEPHHIVSPDRSILEKVILPHLASAASVQKILFVGCSSYTQRYKELFENKEYWTIDPKRVKRKYGSELHIHDSITNVGKYVTKSYFDVIVVNGVIGFGLNRVLPKK